MSVSSRFAEKIDVQFWKELHKKYMSGVNIRNMLSSESINDKLYYNKMYYYFDKIGLPRRDKKPSRNNPEITALRREQKSLKDKGLKKCTRCANIKHLEVFNAKREGAKKNTSTRNV